MSEVASAFVTIVPSFKGGGRAIQKEFEGSLDGNAAGKKAGSGFMGGFGGSVKALAGGLAAGFAGGALVSGIMSSIDAASDLSETINKSTVIFGSNASAIDKWARGAATSMGLSRQAALDAASGFGDMFSQLGFSGDLAASMSQDVVQLSADLGSFNNLGTEDVAQRISAAFRGEYDSLQLLIPNINAARVEQEAMAMTGKRNAKELTAQEKAAATLAIVQKDGARAMGDFARTSDGVANKQKILSARMDDAKAKFGELLLPVKSLALDGFMALMDWGERLAPTFSKIGDGLSALFGGAGGGSELSGRFAAIRDAFLGAFGSVRDFITNQFIPAFMRVVSAVRGWYDAVVPIVMQFVQGVMSNLEPMLPKIMAIFAPRTPRICVSLSERRSVPSKSIRPPRVKRGSVRLRPIIERAVTVLPQPDSPTMQRISPAARLNETSSTRAAALPSRVSVTLRPRTSSSGLVWVGASIVSACAIVSCLSRLAS